MGAGTSRRRQECVVRQIQRTPHVAHGSCAEPSGNASLVAGQSVTSVTAAIVDDSGCRERSRVGTAIVRGLPYGGNVDVTDQLQGTPWRTRAEQYRMEYR